MPCKIKINKNLIAKVQMMSNDALSKPLIEANKIADDINKKFKTPVVSFMKTSSGKLERSIYIPQSLIDTYYEHELTLEKEGHMYINEKEELEKNIIPNIINTNLSTLELNMNNLNLTPEVVNYLYGESSKRLSKETFGIQAKELISILQGSNLTNQEILKKLKCL